MSKNYAPPRCAKCEKPTPDLFRIVDGITPKMVCSGCKWPVKKKEKLADETIQSPNA